MSSRKIIRLGGVFDEHLAAIHANELGFTVVFFAIKEAHPFIFEIIDWRVESLNRLTNQLAAARSEKTKRGGVCFDTSSSVIQDQNAIQGAVENGLKFALRRIKDAGSLALFSPSQNHETDMKGDRHTKSEEGERQQQG